MIPSSIGPFASRSHHQTPSGVNINNINVQGTTSGITGIKSDLVGPKIRNADIMIKPENLIDHVVHMTLAKDFIDSIDESGMVKLRVTNPEFVKANSGLMVFANSGLSNYHQNVATVHKMREFVNGARKSNAIGIDIPLGIVDGANFDEGGNILSNFFKVTEYPTIVYQAHDGNYHHFNGPKTMVSAIKYACENSDDKNYIASGICNMIDFEDHKFEQPAELVGAMVNINLSPETKY